MTALRDPDEYARDAARIDEWAREHHGYPPITEEQAARWWDEGPTNYVGRRRAAEDGTPLRLDDETMADLISARVAHVLRQRGDSVMAYDRALQRLRNQGMTLDCALVAAQQVEQQVAHGARVVLASFGFCIEPDEHAVQHWDTAYWIRTRNEHGRCALCGGAA